MVLLAIWQTWPVWGDFSRTAIGHPANDIWNHIWGFAFFFDAVTTGQMPTHTALLNWPQGGSLWFIDSFNATLTLPVQWIWGPIAAVNAAVFFNFAWAGVATYALAWRVTGTTAGAWLAGVALQTTPHLLGQAYNGITESLSIGWLPLALLAIRHASRQPGPKQGALAGLTISVAAVANWYYGLFAGIALLGLFGRGAWRRWGTGATWPNRLGATLLAGTLTAGLVMVPPFALFRETLLASDAVVMRDPSFVWSTLVMHNMSDLVSMVRPGHHYSPDLKALFDEDLIVVIYLGWALTLPAIAAMVSTARLGVWSWAGFAGLMGVLTLGPFLYVNGDYLSVMGGWVPLPFLALYETVPMFSRISHAYRFVMGLTLGLCMLAAWAIRDCRTRRWPVWPIALTLGFLRIGESFVFSPAVFPLPTSQVSVPQALAELETGAVLDLPVGVPVLARARYSMAQLINKRPSPFGLNDPVPSSLKNNHFTQYLIALEWGDVDTLPASMPWLDLVVGQAAAMSDGLEWVVLHKNWLPPTVERRLDGFLSLVATEVHADEQVRIYRLER